jgi:hypothetical protein
VFIDLKMLFFELVALLYFVPPNDVTKKETTNRTKKKSEIEWSTFKRCIPYTKTNQQQQQQQQQQQNKQNKLISLHHTLQEYLVRCDFELGEDKRTVGDAFDNLRIQEVDLHSRVLKFAQIVKSFGQLPENLAQHSFQTNHKQQKNII